MARARRQSALLDTLAYLGALGRTAGALGFSRKCSVARVSAGFQGDPALPTARTSVQPGFPRPFPHKTSEALRELLPHIRVSSHQKSERETSSRTRARPPS